MRFPHSLGLLYSAFTAYCGFEINEGEYKRDGHALQGTQVRGPHLRDHPRG
ncbi:MAG: carbamoyltransferase N-terminal domain-containing protein [Planctomycetota bacterium]